ncbi:MAG: hypothetical protein B6U76_04010, partial [Desulfurococcales archaeon ex4484_217_2]
LIDRLKTFRAYEDPVEKKSFLLVKFLERRGIFKPIDKENLHVPVDNHLVRIAFRLGIVKLDREILKKVLNGEEFDRYFTANIRRFPLEFRKNMLYETITSLFKLR